ncbi:hypothetical protein SEUCBS139899_002829 [Sporothrix eucalyptigena]|uniref:Uncharacterized protein n=1 Tax=Sporothrix eucalyptigena TaxID=1812306 RepID=A0ABP0BYZ7_9PEZI
MVTASLDDVNLYITDEFCATLTDKNLLHLANMLAEVERHIVGQLRVSYDSALKVRKSLEDDELLTVQRINAAMEQFNDIVSGTRQIGTLYLTDRTMLFYWVRFFDVHNNALKPSRFIWFIKDMIELSKAIVQAITANALDETVMRLLELRWTRTEHFASRVVDYIPESVSTIVWLILTTVVFNTATFALTYYYSPHTRGTWKDADFWSLIQQAITQLIGVAIAAASLMETEDNSSWTWQIPCVVVFCLTAISIPLYLYIPTEWSSFTMLVGGAVQTFLTLQLAIIGV